MSDGLNLCEDCGGAYTLTRYCRLCEEQRMIDAGHDVPELVFTCDYCDGVFPAIDLELIGFGSDTRICADCYETYYGDDDDD